MCLASFLSPPQGGRGYTAAEGGGSASEGAHSSIPARKEGAAIPAAGFPSPSSAKAPEDCPDIACQDTKSMFDKMLKASASKKKSTMGDGDGDGISSSRSKPSGSAAPSLSSTPTANVDAECPANRAELGRASWVLLHSVAAYFPDSPSQDEIGHCKSFFESLSHLYPCSHCAAHFRDYLSRNPLDCSTRQAVSLWLCKYHNEINEMAGKAQFDCSLDVLHDRWRRGSRQCRERMAFKSGTNYTDETVAESLGQSS